MPARYIKQLCAAAAGTNYRVQFLVQESRFVRASVYRRRACVSARTGAKARRAYSSRVA